MATPDSARRFSAESLLCPNASKDAGSVFGVFRISSNFALVEFAFLKSAVSLSPARIDSPDSVQQTLLSQNLASANYKRYKTFFGHGLESRRVD